MIADFRSLLDFSSFNAVAQLFSVIATGALLLYAVLLVLVAGVRVVKRR